MPKPKMITEQLDPVSLVKGHARFETVLEATKDPTAAGGLYRTGEYARRLGETVLEEIFFNDIQDLAAYAKEIQLVAENAKKLGFVSVSVERDTHYYDGDYEHSVTLRGKRPETDEERTYRERRAKRRRAAAKKAAEKRAEKKEAEEREEFERLQKKYGGKKQGG